MCSKIAKNTRRSWNIKEERIFLREQRETSFLRGVHLPTAGFVCEWEMKLGEGLCRTDGVPRLISWHIGPLHFRHPKLPRHPKQHSSTSSPRSHRHKSIRQWKAKRALVGGQVPPNFWGRFNWEDDELMGIRGMLFLGMTKTKTKAGWKRSTWEEFNGEGLHSPVWRGI